MNKYNSLPEDKAITLKDIAEESGYSIKTVSRAIHNHPDINKTTRKIIMEIVKKYNYSPNWAAQSLRSKKTHTIGFVIPNITNGYFGHVGLSIDRLFRENHYSTLICFTSNNHENEIESLNALMNKNVDGIIFAPVGCEGDYYNRVPGLAKKPLVLIDNICRGIDGSYVLHDNSHGASLLVKHLFNHGHTKIACVTGPVEETSGAERLQGYKNALRNCGLPLDETLIKITNWEINGGNGAVLDLFSSSSKKPTAIFFANHQLLLGGYKALHKLGLSIPGDVAVVSFDPPHVIDALSPRPTTLENFEEKIGSAAANLLLDLISKKREIKENKIRVQGVLRIGASCGCKSDF